MASRPSRSSQPPPPPPSSGSSRTNEYFVPRDGIDREVITADICRYLGPDALVRPGTYEQPDGRVIQGYYITAYRNLTTAMIQDLKADSARWEQERRAAARNAAGGTPTSSYSNGAFVRNSNSPVAPSTRIAGGSEYKDSATHYNRQTNGPSSGGPTGPAGYSQPRYDNGPDAMMLDPPYPKYPGTGNAGYNGVNSSGYPPQAGYGQGGYASTAQYPQAGYPSSQTPGYSNTFGGAAAPPQGFAQPEYVSGAQYSVPAYSSAQANQGIPATSRPAYPSAAQPVYASQQDYYPQANVPGNYSQLAQPGDVFYGRGTQAATTQGYGTVPADANFDGSQTPALRQRIPSPKSGSQAQIASSSSAATRLEDGQPQNWDRQARERERERDRDRDRERRHRDQEREERHTDRHHRAHRTRQ